jgi:hypothetical protein
VTIAPGGSTCPVVRRKWRLALQRTGSLDAGGPLGSGAAWSAVAQSR